MYLCSGFFKVIIRWFLNGPDNDVSHASGFFLCGGFAGVVEDDDDHGAEYHGDADEEARGEGFVEDEGADGYGSDRFERAHDGGRRRADEAHGDGHSD